VFQGVFSGFANLTMLSFRNSNLITAAGMHCFAHLVNLKHLDLECCPHIHGGLVHIKGLTNLEKLNVGWCISIKNSDVKNLAGLVNLEELQISRSKVNDVGIASLKGLKNLRSLSMEGCPVTSQCMETIGGTVFKDLRLSVSFHSQSSVVLLCFPQLQTLQMELLEPTPGK
jgi:Leucine-rich repeat (LRR) protein